MHLYVDPHDKTPVYRQIEEQIAEAIAEHRLRPGDELLPEHELAANLVVSPASVRKAYSKLESQGLCRSSALRGFRVATPEPTSRTTRGARAAEVRRNHELLVEELKLAGEAQQRLLPPARLEGEHWRVEARTHPAGTLTGDFYDVQAVEGGGVRVVVADVAGKGLAAGLIMAAVKSILPFVTAGRAADATLRELNRRLYPILGRREFVALIHACFERVDGALEIANAGLPDPYLLRTDGTIETLSVTGPRLPLGVRQGVSYSALRLTIEPGDRLLLVTDGIPEAIDRRGEPIGYPGLKRILESALRADRSHSDASRASRSLLDRLIERASELTEPILADDWTAVLLTCQD